MTLSLSLDFRACSLIPGEAQTCSVSDPLFQPTVLDAKVLSRSGGVLLHTTFREDYTISIANMTSVRTQVLQTENVNKNSYPFHSSKIPEKRFPFFISP